MKTLKHAILGFAALLFVSAPVMAAPNVGEMAPEIEGINTLTGEAFKLSDHKDEIIVLEWTNHQCPYVIKHYDSGNMQKIQKETTAKGVKWVSINSSAEGMQGHISSETAKQIVMDAGAAPSVKLLDPSGKIGFDFGARTTPHMFVIKDGIVQYAGAIDDNSSPRQSVIADSKNYVLAAIDDLMAGKAVEVPSTQPYGCSVKYAK